MRRFLLIAAGLLAALLALAQLALPRLAARVVVDRLGGRGEVIAAKVSALPAIELLWGRADAVSARVRSYDARSGDVADDLAETAHVDRLDVTIERVRAADGVELRDVRVRKRDGVLSGSALLDPRRLAGALPAGVSAAIVPRADGAVVVEAVVKGIPARLRVVARDGRLVARPDGLLGIFAAYTLFADPRIAIESVAARPRPDGRFELSARARVAS